MKQLWHWRYSRVNIRLVRWWQTVAWRIIKLIQQSNEAVSLTIELYDYRGERWLWKVKVVINSKKFSSKFKDFINIAPALIVYPLSSQNKQTNKKHLWTHIHPYSDQFWSTAFAPFFFTLWTCLKASTNVSIWINSSTLKQGVTP